MILLCLTTIWLEKSAYPQQFFSDALNKALLKKLQDSTGNDYYVPNLCEIYPKE